MEENSGSQTDLPARGLLALYDELTALNACSAFVMQALAAALAGGGGSWTNGRRPGRCFVPSGIVEYTLRNLNTPIGVAEWQTRLVRSLPKELKPSLPSIQQLEKELTSESGK